MVTHLSVLILEDRPTDAELMLHELRQAGFETDWQRVETETDYVAALLRAAKLGKDLDLILADYTLPKFDALRALHLLQEHGLDVPFIVVTGSVGEEAAVACIKQGAADYLLKDRMTRLGPAVIQALQTKELRDERKQLEEQMQQQEQLAAVGQLAGGIAHDFNNLLNTIMLYAQIPLSKHDLPPDVKRAFETILSESRQAARLVQQILDFSRRSPIQTRLVDIAPFIKESIRVLERTIPENISFLLKMETGEHAAPLTVNADPTRIQQVLMNLVINARDAMPEGGELRIGLFNKVVATGELVRDEVSLDVRFPAAKIASNGIPGGKWVCLTVSDTGTGMTEQVRSHLFEPFFTTKEPGKGTGLGLAQVHGIVKQHGGHIRVKTEIGQGTTFHVYLPAYESKAAEVSEKALAIQNGKGEIILLAEDDKGLREGTQETLESLNYRVLPVANGEEALKVYHSTDEIALVLTDLVMPKMGGRELIRELRKTDPCVRVLVFTGYVLPEELEGLKETEILGTIQKPFETNTLAETIRRALDAE
ncbi:MAG: response regulator [Chloroflexota bacterium]|nr:response regulator [Chloroflexota bacterium]